jgi:hypothetical protein
MPLCQRCHQSFELKQDVSCNQSLEKKLTQLRLSDDKLQRFNRCQYHPASFVCRPHPPDHYAFELNNELYEKLQKKNWAARFWDCCGNENPNAPGCEMGDHLPY